MPDSSPAHVCSVPTAQPQMMSYFSSPMIVLPNLFLGTVLGIFGVAFVRALFKMSQMMMVVFSWL